MPEHVTKNPQYRARIARLLTSARSRAGLSVADMAALVSIDAVFSEPVTAREWATWENPGVSVSVPVAALFAAMNAAGVRHAGELEGTLPDSATEAATEAALGEVRLLLDDPAALMRRARRLIEGVVS